MKSVCLILILGHQIVGIDKPFPSDDACNRGGFSMTDGVTIKGFSCLPQTMVDGIPTYDCGKYPIEVNLSSLPPDETKCRFEIMKPNGKIITTRAECNAEIPGTINILPPKFPKKKYQRPLE